MFDYGLDLNMAIIGAGNQVSAACRLDEIEVLADFMLASDSRLRLDCAIVNTDGPLNEAEMVLLVRSAALLGAVATAFVPSAESLSTASFELMTWCSRVRCWCK